MHCSGVVVVTNRLRVEIDKVAGRNESMWKIRLKNKIKELRKDLDQKHRKIKILVILDIGKDQKKNSIRIERLNVVIQESKQRITAIATKVRRYQGRVDSCRQNRLSENNQRQFYRELDQEKERHDDEQPVAEESKQFWGNIQIRQKIIRTIQSGYKTCEVKLMLKKNRRSQILAQEV